MLDENYLVLTVFVLVACAFVLVACAAVVVIIFISAKTILFMHKAKLGLQMAAKDSPGETQRDEITAKAAKPKKERRHLFKWLSKKNIKDETEDFDNDDLDYGEESSNGGEPERKTVIEGDERRDGGHVKYEQGRGYCFDTSCDEHEQNDDTPVEDVLDEPDSVNDAQENEDDYTDDYELAGYDDDDDDYGVA